MAFTDKFLISIHGRHLGLQRVTTAISGGTRGDHDFLVGTFDGCREYSSTAGVTAPAASGVAATNLLPFGYDIINGSTIGGTYTYPLDPPIPGTNTKKIVSPTTDAVIFIRVGSSIGAASPAIVSSAGSSATTVRISSQGGMIELFPLTTALWGLVNGSTLNGNSFTTTT